MKFQIRLQTRQTALATEQPPPKDSRFGGTEDYLGVLQDSSLVAAGEKEDRGASQCGRSRGTHQQEVVCPLRGRRALSMRVLAEARQVTSYLICIRFSSMLQGFLGVTGTGIPCCCR